MAIRTPRAPMPKAPKPPRAPKPKGPRGPRMASNLVDQVGRRQSLMDALEQANPDRPQAHPIPQPPKKRIARG
jgi:hypothetical protein